MRQSTVFRANRLMDNSFIWMSRKSRGRGISAVALGVLIIAVNHCDSPWGGVTVD